jgi:chromosome segregation ATPase
MLLKELDAARNRNAWYASELELARKAGYVPNSSLSPTLDSRATETFDDEDKPLIEALLAMRTELANVQASVDKQAVLAAKQIAEAERQRDAAIQEAIYAKAKLAGLGGSATSTPQLDRDVEGDDRVGETSRKLANALNTQRELQNQLERMSQELEAEKKARKLSDDTANAAQKRMADLETYKQQNSLELERLRAELHQAQKESRQQAVEAAEAVATVQLLRVEKDDLHRKVEESTTSSKDQEETFESLRRAVVASAETKTVLERMLEEEKSLRAQADLELTKLRAEHEARTAELVVATQRLRDAEATAEQHANEARLHQQAVVSGLEKISARSIATPNNKGDTDRISALQSQLAAANALVRKYQQDADTASDRLRSAEERIAGLEAYQEQASREGVTIRRQLQAAMRETQTLQAANSDLQHQLSNQQLEANAITVQHNTLKDLLAERGISPTSAVRSRGLNSPRQSSPDQERLQHLEQELLAAHAAHEETKNTLEAHTQEAEAQAQEAESQYREKLAQLENDYLSAVQYVKGTEKMLKQLKEQLSRFKTENSRLKEQVVELEDKIADDARNAKAVPADWEAERDALQNKINSLQTELQSSSTKLEGQMQSVRQELANARRERDNISYSAEETNRLLSSSKRDLEQLQQENALLERRAQDAEQKVTLLLDQVETSVDTYRRQSRQRMPSLHSETSNLPAATAAPPTNGNGPLSLGAAALAAGGLGHGGHARQVSSEAGSLYDGPASNARDSTALDNLANELETLRSHWEATNKNYRLSNTFDFEPGTPTRREEAQPAAAASGLGLSESLADWRKRLDEEPEGPGAAR